MKALKRSSLFAVALAACFTLTSATVITPIEPSNMTPIEGSVSNIENLSTKEMIQYAEQLKGDELTAKEKLAIKVFGKKALKKHQGNVKQDGKGKSQLIALILVIVVGALGIHRFYLGHIGTGILMLLTLGGLGIWALIDLILIAMGKLKPKGGEYEETL